MTKTSTTAARTARYGTKSCRTCAATFAASPAGATVHCPKHRTRGARIEAAAPVAPRVERTTCIVCEGEPTPGIITMRMASGGTSAVACHGCVGRGFAAGARA